tara:strand:- start:1723 stop:2274 length:552 start_codon:yes stop_codon:yes gene_type:complete
MRARHILLFTLIILGVGCKSDKKETEAIPVETPKEKKEVKVDDSKNLKLFFDGTFAFSDYVKLYFDDDIVTNDSLVAKLNKNPNAWQRLKYVFPDETTPYEFKIQLPKSSETYIKFDKIVLNKENSRIIIKDSTLLVYFDLVNLKHSFKNNKIELKKKDTLKAATLIAKKALVERILNRYKQK